MDVLATAFAVWTANVLPVACSLFGWPQEALVESAARPDIQIVAMQLEDKQLLGASLREAAIKTVLRRLSLLLRLIHGPMDALLAKVCLATSIHCTTQGWV